MLGKTTMQNRISALETEIKILKKENESIRKENISLKEMNTLLKNNFDKALKDYMLGLREIKDLKKKYDNLISDVSKSKKGYEDKISNLINEIKNKI
jgi:predicted  nucleic acid-binding Zn-ribbon protein